jgi:hypothetical protein
MTRTTMIDLITEQKDGNFVVVAVEQGPWAPDEIMHELRRIQDRLYDLVDVVVDGHLAIRYPNAKGKAVTIRLDCYNTPKEQVTEFFQRFVATISNSEEITETIRTKGFITKLEFEINARAIN